MHRFLCCAVALAMLGSAVDQAKADPNFVYTTLTVPNAGVTTPAAINSAGQIVGSYVDGHQHGFLLSGGVFTTLDVPGSIFTAATGINDLGQISGTYGDAGGFHGFLLSGGNYITLDVPGATGPGLGTLAGGINNSGQIVGTYFAGGTNHGFLLSGGVYTTLDVPGASSTSAAAINAAGQIVGQFWDPHVVAHGFLLTGGNYITLDVPGSGYTAATGINDSGAIVGSYSNPSEPPNVSHSFLLSGGSYTTFNVPGASATLANGINTSGAIAGGKTDAAGNEDGFLATPVTAFAWHGPTTVTTNVAGSPSLVQAIPGTYGIMGNYELVVPLQSGGMAHFYRNNDDPNLPWNGPFTFATDQGTVAAVSLIQSNFSSAGNGPGNLAVVARIGNQLVYYYREDVNFTWHGPTSITTGVSGVPSFVQARPGSYGTKGNYELVVPLATGGVSHFYRDNDDPNLPWVQTATFGSDLGSVDAVSIVQSDFSTAGNGPGNLAVVARVGSDLLYFYRDDLAPYAWHGPVAITTGVTGNPSFVQAIPGTYGSMGNYELAVPLASGGIAHFYRNNDDPNLPWVQTATFGTDLSLVSGISLIQSNFSTTGSGPGNLAVVTVSGGQLDYFYRND